MVSEPVCSAPAVASGWSVVTSVIVMGTEPVTTFAMDSRTALTVEGVKQIGTAPSRLPQSLVA
jgi:hypothetical protein